MHGCILSTVATDVLALKHQAISIQSADQIIIALASFRQKYYVDNEQNSMNKNKF